MKVTFFADLTNLKQKYNPKRNPSKTQPLIVELLQKLKLENE